MRRWIADKLVRLARKIDPENKLVRAFWNDRFEELIITGQSAIKIERVQLNPTDAGGHE